MVQQSHSYDAAGRVTGISNLTWAPQVAGAKRSMTYDGFGRLASQSVSTPADVVTGTTTYQWDLGDNLVATSATGDLHSVHSDWRYTYDEAGRLVTAQDTGSATGEDYRWDSAGNLSKRTPWTGTAATKVLGSPTTFQYDQRNELLQALSPAATRSYSYTKNGSLAAVTTATNGSSSTRSVGFDALGRLVTDSAAGAGEFGYDGLDRLVTVPGGSQRYDYDRLDREPSDASGSDRWHIERLPDGTAVGERTSTTSAPRDLLLSPHGDVAARIDPISGAIAGTATFDPFGATVTQGASSPIGWQGSLTEPSNGLVHADARWYDVTAGRFLSQDTRPGAITTAASANLYAYGNANPTTFADPNGHFALSAVWGGFSDFASESIGSIARAAASRVGTIALQGLRAGAMYAGAVLLDALAGITLGGVLVTLGVIAVVAVVAVGGYYAYQYYQDQSTTTSSTTTTTTTGTTASSTTSTGSTAATAATPAVVDTPAVVPVVKPKPVPYIVRTKPYPKTSPAKVVRRWNDGKNVYVKTVTTTTTTTVTWWSDGSRTSVVGDPVRNPPVIESVPLFDSAAAYHDAGTGTVTWPQVIRPPSATSDGQCGAGGTVEACAPERQPGQPRAPTVQEPTPDPGGGGARTPPPPRKPGSGSNCDDDDPRGGVYSLRDEGGNVVRTGRTNDLRAREADHLHDPVLGRYRFVIEHLTDSYAEQRGLEQLLYDANPRAQSANGGYNKIRGISPSNPRGPGYLDAARSFLDELGC